MQIKNKLILIILFIFSLIVYEPNLNAEEFNISASEIVIDKQNNIIVGKGSVEVTDSEGKLIKADKATYEKSKEFLLTEGSVEIYDIEGNILKTNKAAYDKIKEMITTYENSELILKEGYKLTSDKIFYNALNKVISSDRNSIFTDLDGNIVTVSMFNYDLQKNLFSSVGEIKVIDGNKNQYFFKELHVDTKSKEMIGSDVSAVLDQENFGVSKQSDPRFVANDIFMSKDTTNFSKGVFTVCQQKDGKCPPWSIKAKKIRHDKIKKTIYYEHATLKVYGIPIFYFPRFFHPDPTVKRQSGFLSPFFTNSTTLKTGFGLPYFWAISHDKDLTFTPKIYTKENILFLNEYRQAFRNGFLTLDTSYTEGYKNTSATKTDGSRNHIFAELDFNFNDDPSYESSLSIKTQRTSNDTYFRAHNINTALVDEENTNMENKVRYSFSKNNMYLNVSATLYENLREKTNDRYEYILPNIMYGKTFFTEKFGSLDFKSNALYKNYSTNTHTTFLTNDIIWNSNPYIAKNGFVNTLTGMIKNTNYEAKNTSEYKTQGTVNELSSVLNLKSSLPMQKDGLNFSKIFSPNFAIRYAPGHMRNLSGDDVTLNYSNLYATNKTSQIENGLSAILGFDFKMNKKIENDSEKEKLSISMGQVFRPQRNEDIPSKSSLDQKMSDVVGEFNYNFSKIGKIGYKFSLDNNFNDFNYNEITSKLNFGKIGFNLDYLEQRKHIGSEHYVNTGISLNLNKNNKFEFATKKNFKTNSTELYDISYQYAIDCLTAGLVFRREFYEDNDIEQKDTLMFVIKFVPFTGVKSPSFIRQ